MTKEDVTQKIKEILAKDKTFADAKVKIIFSKKIIYKDITKWTKI